MAIMKNRDSNTERATLHHEVVRTVVHDLRLVLSDDLMGKIELNDEVYINLAAREGEVRIKLNYRQLSRMLEGDPRLKKQFDLEDPTPEPY